MDSGFLLRSTPTLLEDTPLPRVLLLLPLLPPLLPLLLPPPLLLLLLLSTPLVLLKSDVYVPVLAALPVLGRRTLLGGDPFPAWLKGTTADLCARSRRL